MHSSGSQRTNTLARGTLIGVLLAHLIGASVAPTTFALERGSTGVLRTDAASVAATPSPLSSQSVRPAGASVGTPTPTAGTAADAALAPRRASAAEPADIPSATTKAATVRHGDRSETTAVLAVERTADGKLARAGSVLVTYRAGARPTDGAADGAAGVEAIRGTSTNRVQVAPGTVDAAIAALAARPDIARAEPDYIVTAGMAPNDPRYGEQWGLAKIGASGAWDRVGGAAGVRVAILDTGIFSASSRVPANDGLPGHPELRDRVVLEQNFTPSTLGVEDVWGHGTHVAGIAAASANNGLGGAGLSYAAHIMNGKVLGDDGAGSISTLSNGIVWAADNGAKVINMSLGAPMACPSSLQGAVDYAWQRGVVLVAAAGNDGTSATNTPANCAHVVPVGATDSTDGRAGFSNYGPGVPVAAPGVAILSTEKTGEYSFKSGTSMASPYVAGLAAAVWASPFGGSNQAVIDRILATADRIPGAAANWGAGRINAAVAVGGTMPAPPTPTPAPVATVAPTQPPTPTPAPSRPAPPDGPCTPRPPVTVAIWNVSPGVLGVRVSSTARAANARASSLQQIRFGAAVNATIQVESAPASTGTFALTVPASASSVTFIVTRIQPGQFTTVPLTVVDECGDWPTFVGGGPAAF